jgi:branched-chain amino acid transport system ATP-binding protein
MSLIMDEPSEGLAPKVIQQISQVIEHLRSTLSVLLVKQNLNMALKLADYVYVITKGVIVCESRPQELRNNSEIKTKYLGV